MPGLGTLPADWLDLPLLAARAAQGQPRRGACADCSLRYGEPAGDARLRQALAHKLAEHRRARPTPQQIVTTIGATQALDVVTRTLLRAGDAVLVDEPGWAVEYARLAALGMRVLPVPRGEDGPDLARDAAADRARHQPRLYVTVSVLHNPTGASLSLQPRAPAAAAGRRRTTCTSSRTTPTPTWRRRTCRGWPRWTGCSARSTSRASRRSWRRTGASASWPRRRRWSTAWSTPSCCPR